LLGEQFTPANFYYVMPPGNSVSAEIQGALLSDPIDASLPIRYYVKNMLLSEKKISFWNPYNGMGYSLESEIASILGYLPNWFILLLPISVGLLAFTFFEMYLCLWGMYLLLGRFGLSNTSRLIGATTYTFSGTIIAWLLWPHTSVAMLAPFLFYFTDRIIQNKNPRLFIALVFIVTQMLYSGMPPYVAYFYYLLGLFVIWRTIESKQGFKYCLLNIGILFIIAIISSLISLPYTISLLGKIKETDYLSQRTNYYQSVFSIKLLSQLIIPNHRYIKGHFNESAMYIGLFPIISILIAPFLLRKKKNILFWFAISLLVLFTTFTHSFDLIFKNIPLINTSLKTRTIILFVFSGTILNAHVIDNILKDNSNKKLILLGITLLLFFSVLRYIIFNDKIAAGMLSVVLIFYLLIIMPLQTVKNKQSITMQVVIFLVIFIDLNSKLINYNPYIGKYTPSLPVTDSIEFLKEQEGYNRFVALGAWTLFPNSGMRYKLNDIRSHSLSVTSPNMIQFLKHINSNAYASKTRIAFSHIDDPFGLSLANVKFIIAENKDQPHEKMSLVRDLQKTSSTLFAESLDIRIKLFLPKMEINRLDFFVTPIASSSNAGEDITLTIVDRTQNQTLLIKKNSIFHPEYNNRISFTFENVNIIANHEYELSLHTDNQGGNKISIPLYPSLSLISPDKLVLFEINGEKHSSYMNIQFIKEHDSLIFDRSFNDGTHLFINKEALNRVYLSRNIDILPPNKIIENMLNEKELGKVYFSESISLNNLEIKDNEYAKIVEYEPGFVKIITYVDDNAIMVLSDNYDKNWQATVNGITQSIIPVNGLFRGILLESGYSEIEMFFIPNQLRRGVFVSLGILSILFGSLFIYSAYSKRIAQE
jgi:uncharacterized membrane protein YfhO